MASNIMLTLLFLGVVLVVHYLAPPRDRWKLLLTATPDFLCKRIPLDAVADRRIGLLVMVCRREN